jgi:hypothetical protein
MAQVASSWRLVDRSGAAMARAERRKARLSTQSGSLDCGGFRHCRGDAGLQILRGLQAQGFGCGGAGWCKFQGYGTQVLLGTPGTPESQSSRAPAGRGAVAEAGSGFFLFLHQIGRSLSRGPRAGQNWRSSWQWSDVVAATLLHVPPPHRAARTPVVTWFYLTPCPREG